MEWMSPSHFYCMSPNLQIGRELHIQQAVFRVHGLPCCTQLVCMWLSIHHFWSFFFHASVHPRKWPIWCICVEGELPWQFTFDTDVSNVNNHSSSPLRHVLHAYREKSSEMKKSFNILVFENHTADLKKLTPRTISMTVGAWGHPYQSQFELFPFIFGQWYEHLQESCDRPPRWADRRPCPPHIALSCVQSCIFSRDFWQALKTVQFEYVWIACFGCWWLWPQVWFSRFIEIDHLWVFTASLGHIE